MHRFFQERSGLKGKDITPFLSFLSEVDYLKLICAWPHVDVTPLEGYDEEEFTTYEEAWSAYTVDINKWLVLANLPTHCSYFKMAESLMNTGLVLPDNTWHSCVKTFLNKEGKRLLLWGDNFNE